MIFQKYAKEGFAVAAFPANNFMGQEPGTNGEIKQFCRVDKAATFDLYAKVSVKGKDICPLYKFLTTHPDKDIKGKVEWNFQKYLIGRDGQVIAKFGPRTKPDDQALIAAIEKALEAPKPEAPAKSGGE